MRLPFKAWYIRSTIDENLVHQKLPVYTVELIGAVTGK